MKEVPAKRQRENTYLERRGGPTVEAKRKEEGRKEVKMGKEETKLTRNRGGKEGQKKAIYN